MDILNLAAQNKIKRVFLARNKADFEGAISHITQHSCGSEPLFTEENDYLYFLGLLKERSQKYELDIFAFCLMPNHVHLLLRNNKANLGMALGSLFRAYAGYFNKKYERKGHVFSGSYRQALCFSEVYLLAASAYIHLNPFKAGLVKDYLAYRWSSCRLYLELIDKQTFINFKYPLQLLASEVNKAQEAYKKLLDQLAGVKITISENEGLNLERTRIKTVDFLHNLLPISNFRVLSDNILMDMKIEEKIKELKEKKQLMLPQEIEARKFLISQLIAKGYKINDIAEKLDYSRKTISKIINVK